ncbi:MAG: gliding motility lipoprotein GldJ [Flavobacteriaceae bacterium]|nr:gliding motility lipoprotein GldJ [Flavobacteriaceae bacterium]|tara:strand:- start:12617 stop:14260 length:1644 start_codon:yes stop_codon:yes gene_type:complete
MDKKLKFYASILFSMVLLFSFESCNKSQFSPNRNISQGTGWDINSKKGGFQYNTNFKGQEAPPNMVLVEGGTYTKGKVQDDPMRDWNNTPNQQHVQSFYMDQTEVTNKMYLEYLDWLKRNFPPSESKFRDIYKNALPDTLVWRNKLGYAEDMVNNYLRHPAFANYPVVGVSWLQAYEYSEWRSDRYQELVLERNGFLVRDAKTDSVNSQSSFSLDTYVIDPNSTYGGNSNVLRGKQTRTPDSLLPKSASRESGFITPKFRLPTESEWEYAALGLTEMREFNNYSGRKKYPWKGQYTRTGQRRNLGDQLANFKNSDGDYGGIAGWSDDGADITNQVGSYNANSFGLYDMAGNVAEWVADVYRPIVDDEFNDFNYFRGNDYKKFKIDENGVVIASEAQYKTLPNGKRIAIVLPGEIERTDLDDEDTRYRTQFDKGYNINFRDGDNSSSRRYDRADDEESSSQIMYKSPDYNDTNLDNDVFDYDSDISKTTLINDQVRVFKGGSWKDRAYWLDPAQRRFYPQDQATDFIGFRCAMSRLGSKTSSKKKTRN